MKKPKEGSPRGGGMNGEVPSLDVAPRSYANERKPSKKIESHPIETPS